MDRNRNEFNRRKKPKSLSEALNELFARRIVPGRLELTQIHEAWQEVAGPEIANQTRVTSFRDQTLLVEASSSALIFELESFHRRRIEIGLKQRPGLEKLRRIRFAAERK